MRRAWTDPIIQAIFFCFFCKTESPGLTSKVAIIDIQFVAPVSYHSHRPICKHKYPASHRHLYLPLLHLWTRHHPKIQPSLFSYIFKLKISLIQVQFIECWLQQKKISGRPSLFTSPIATPPPLKKLRKVYGLNSSV